MIIKEIFKIQSGKKIIFSVLFFFFLFLLLTKFFIFSPLKQIKNIAQEINDEKEMLEKNSIDLNMSEAFLNIKKAENDLSNLNEKIFVDKNFGDKLFVLLENMAIENNLNQSLSFLGSPQEIESGYQKISLRSISEGNFKDQMKYLQDLEDFSYHLNIKMLEFSSGSESVVFVENPPEKKIKMTVLFDSYWR